MDIRTDKEGEEAVLGLITIAMKSSDERSLEALLTVKQSIKRIDDTLLGGLAHILIRELDTLPCHFWIDALRVRRYFHSNL